MKMICTYCGKKNSIGHHCSGKDAFEFGYKRALAEIAALPKIVKEKEDEIYISK